ncbi:PINIT domain-containing protein [Xylaria flabelliformis]|nr:PINIT domain-containing protein [Xylaria flabelliformis]
MTSSNGEIRQLERTLTTMLNKQLQQICSLSDLKTSGVKAELQNRIKSYLVENYTSNPAKFRRMQNHIQGLIRPGDTIVPQQQSSMAGSSSNGPPYGHSYTPTKSSSYTTTPQGYSFQQAQPVSGYGASGAAGSSGTLSYYKNAHQALRDLQFKPSPFYSIISRIGDIRTCDPMNQHRNTIHLSMRVSEHPTLANLANDKSYRVMLFCAADNASVQDIAFPHQSEIKVNGGDVKANLRGLKGKPGTTRPVDITDSLRLKPSNYNNNIEFTYALTHKVKKHDPSPAATKFYLAAYFCKSASVDELVAKIRGRKINKTTVIQEMNKKANDPDVIATSTVLSLKCPLSYTRIRTPVRSVLCNHISCFDGSSYLQLQEQGPQWLCPICNQSAPFENLAVDEYAKDILEKTEDSVEQVTIEPNGQWATQPTETAPRKSRSSNVNTSIDVDDDVSIVTDNPSYSNGGYGSTPHTYSTPIRTFMGTPSASSREPSGAPRSGGRKRPAAEVIDLTLSSDEDDAPLTRPSKKQNLGPISAPHY